MVLSTELIEVSDVQQERTWLKWKRTCTVPFDGEDYLFSASSNGGFAPDSSFLTGRNVNWELSLCEADRLFKDEDQTTVIAAPRWYDSIIRKELRFPNGLRMQLPVLPIGAVAFSLPKGNGQLFVGRKKLISLSLDRMVDHDENSILKVVFYLCWVNSLYGWH